jgi:hypothetical protein
MSYDISPRPYDKAISLNEFTDVARRFAESACELAPADRLYNFDAIPGM